MPLWGRPDDAPNNPLALRCAPVERPSARARSAVACCRARRCRCAAGRPADRTGRRFAEHRAQFRADPAGPRSAQSHRADRCGHSGDATRRYGCGGRFLFARQRNRPGQRAGEGADRHRHAQGRSAARCDPLFRRGASGGRGPVDVRRRPRPCLRPCRRQCRRAAALPAGDGAGEQRRTDPSPCIEPGHRRGSPRRRGDARAPDPASGSRRLAGADVRHGDHRQSGRSGFGRQCLDAGGACRGHRSLPALHAATDTGATGCSGQPGPLSARRRHRAGRSEDCAIRRASSARAAGGPGSDPGGRGAGRQGHASRAPREAAASRARAAGGDGHRAARGARIGDVRAGVDHRLGACVRAGRDDLGGSGARAASNGERGGACRAADPGFARRGAMGRPAERSACCGDAGRGIARAPGRGLITERRRIADAQRERVRRLSAGTARLAARKRRAAAGDIDSRHARALGIGRGDNSVGASSGHACASSRASACAGADGERGGCATGGRLPRLVRGFPRSGGRATEHGRGSRPFDHPFACAPCRAQGRTQAFAGGRGQGRVHGRRHLHNHGPCGRRVRARARPRARRRAAAPSRSSRSSDPP